MTTYYGRRQQFNPFGGFGTLPQDDPDYQAAWAVLHRAQTSASFAALNVPGTNPFNAFNNLNNTLVAISEGKLTLDSQRDVVRGWTWQLATLVPEVQRVSEAHPELATIVRNFYSRYLHRTGSLVDDAGLDNWVGNIVRDGPPPSNVGLRNAENAFRVSAVEQSIFTEATLPAWLYPENPAGTIANPPMPPPPNPPVPEPGGGIGGSSGGGGIADTVSGIFDKVSEMTGLSAGIVQAGAVVLGLGAVLYFSSSGSTSRKR